MKAHLKLWLLSTLSLTPLSVVACNNANKTNTIQKLNNSNKEYVPKQPLSSYPDFTNSYVHEDMYENLSDYWVDFYKLKGKKYFTKNIDKVESGEWSNDFKYVIYDYQTIFNVYELYDYAHDKYLEMLYPNWNNYSSETKNRVYHNNLFAYKNFIWDN